ncbi:MAG: hypothetical protein JHD16_14840, partial [Solirubrobacteraceae bacterium]|nr:hypothetical protein [Solirubrobacteraceae bacterium]
MPTQLRLTGALAAAVMTAAIAFVAPGSALAATCDNTFTGPSGERWNTAANWTAATNPSDHHIPTTTENVCIPAGKRVVVNEPGIANAADVTIDAGAAVEILSEAGFGDSQASWANVDNAGLIEFTASGAGNGQLRIGNGKVLTNTGTIRANQTGGGTSYILGDLANAVGGTVEVKTPLVAQSAGGIPLLWTNAGQFTVDAGTSFKTSSQQPIEYRQTGGTTTVNGLFELLGASDRLAATGGAFNGSSTPLIHNGQLALTGGTGTVRTNFGTPSLAADVGAGWTIRIEDRGSTPTTLRIPAGAARTNAGTIRYAVDPTATDSRVITSITVGTGGVLTNTGTIVSDAALTHRTELAGDFTNAPGGTLTVNKAMYVSASGVGVLVVWNNAGTITVPDTGSIYDNTYRWTLSQTGGTMTANGPIDIGPAVATRFVVSGGTVEGTRPPRMRSGTIELTGGTGTVRVQSGLAALGTDVPAGWTVRVEDRGRLTVPAGAQRTNAGTIRFRHDPEFTIGGEVPSIEVAADGRLTNTGAIIAEPTTNFTVAIKALKLDADSLADPTAFVQNGILDLQHAEVALPPFTQNAGTTTIAAGTRASVGTPSNAKDPGVELAGGTLTGSGRLFTRSLENTGGTFAPVSGGASPFELSWGYWGLSPADVDGGDYIQGPGGTLRVRLSATGTGVTVGGKIRLAGTLDLAPSTGFTPPAGQTYQVLRIKNIRDNTAARSGTFGTVVGPLTPTYELDGVDTTAPYPAGTSSFSVADESTFENTTFTFTVKRSAPATGSATVHWALRKTGSADPLTGDYPIGSQGFPFQGDLSFADGETQKTITTVWAGTADGPEPDETFQFHLSHPTNIPISRPTATATIFNYDPQLDAVTPNTLGNSGPTTVRLVGAGLSSRTVVRLQHAGRPDLEPVSGSFRAASDGKSAVVTFDTTGVTPLDNNWVLRTTLPGNTRTRPITLQASTGGAQPWAQLAGPSSLRGGLPSTSTLLWGNTGDAASPPGLLHLTGYPYGAEITVTGAPGAAKPQVIDGGTGRSLVLAVGAIPARSVNSIQIRYLPSTTIAGHTILELQPLLTFTKGPIPALTGQTATGATDRTAGPGELFSTDLSFSGGATARLTYSQEAATDPVSKPGITREGNTWIFRGTPQTQDEAPRSLGDGKIDVPYSQGLLKVDLSGEQIQITG